MNGLFPFAQKVYVDDFAEFERLQKIKRHFEQKDVEQRESHIKKRKVSQNLTHFYMILRRSRVVQVFVFMWWM